MRQLLPLRPLLLAALLLCGRPIASRAQGATPGDSLAIVIGRRAMVHSAILGEDRPLLIHTPATYGLSRRVRYPVLYLLDGEVLFEPVTAMTDFLARNGRAPEMIVVAIPNTRDRTHDLTPPTDTGVIKFAINASGDTVSQRFPTAGGAAKFRAFLTTELRPWVDSTYHTAPYRILVGHSFGGLFALDALQAEPRAFNAYVAISPSLWWDHEQFEKRVEAALARAPLGGLALYMTTGEREPADAMIAPARRLAARLATRTDGFRSWYRVMPAETHNTNPMRTTYDALERIFDGWEASEAARNAALLRGDLTGLETHHAAITKKFGIASPLLPDEVNSMAYFNLGEKRVDAAVRLFRRNIELHPDYANGWDSLADGLEAQGKLAEAIAAQEKAVEIGERMKDPNVAGYREHLERLRKSAKR
jgi:uncharacterized protein